MAEKKPEAWNIPYAKIGAGAVVIKDDLVLLVQPNYGPAKGLWILPGGRVEPGELLHDGVAREVFEETGLRVIVGAVVGFRQRHQVDGLMDIYFMFRCSVASESAAQKPLTGDVNEILEARFWSISEALASADVRPTTRKAIELAISGRTGFSHVKAPVGAAATDFFFE